MKKAVILIGLILFNVISIAAADDDHDHDHDHDHEDDHDDGTWSKGEKWAYGILSSLGVSCLGFILALILSVFLRGKRISKELIQKVSNVMIAFAIGALIGDTFIHIIPEIFGAHHHGEEDHVHEEEETEEEESKPDPRLTSLFMLIGILVFTVVDKLAGHNHSHVHPDPHCHNKAHHHLHQHDEEAKNIELKVVKEGDIQITAPQDQSPKEDPAEAKKLVSTKNQVNTDSSPKVAKNSEQKKSLWMTLFNLKDKSSEGYLLLIANLLHNFMDGLALGTSFSSNSKNTAISTLIAVVAHEIPHELGDLGVLIHAKFSVTQAVACNLVTNMGAVLGAIIGVAIGSMSEVANAYLMGIVAGNFLYISLANMMPAVMEEKKPKISAMMILAAIVGAGLMYAVLEIEEKTEH